MRTILDYVPIYRPRHFGRAKVDGLRPFAESGFLNYRGFPIPDSGRTNVAGRAQLEDQISVRPGSFLTMISSVSDQAAGFKFNIYDKASGDALYDTLVRDTVAASRPIAALGNRRLPTYLQSPWAVPEPGLLTIRLVNLATVPNELQLYLVFAEPTGGSVFSRVRQPS